MAEYKREYLKIDKPLDTNCYPTPATEIKGLTDEVLKHAQAVTMTYANLRYSYGRFDDRHDDPANPGKKIRVYNPEKDPLDPLIKLGIFQKDGNVAMDWPKDVNLRALIEAAEIARQRLTQIDDPRPQKAIIWDEMSSCISKCRAMVKAAEDSVNDMLD